MPLAEYRALEEALRRARPEGDGHPPRRLVGHRRSGRVPRPQPAADRGRRILRAPRVRLRRGLPPRSRHGRRPSRRPGRRTGSPRTGLRGRDTRRPGRRPPGAQRVSPAWHGGRPRSATTCSPGTKVGRSLPSATSRRSRCDTGSEPLFAMELAPVCFSGVSTPERGRPSAFRTTHHICAERTVPGSRCPGGPQSLVALRRYLRGAVRRSPTGDVPDSRASPTGVAGQRFAHDLLTRKHDHVRLMGALPGRRWRGAACSASVSRSAY